MNTKTVALVVLAAATLGTGAAATARDLQLAQGGWYGPSRPYRDNQRADWAVGTFHGQNGANGHEETITIRPDGSAEVRTARRSPEVRHVRR